MLLKVVGMCLDIRIVRYGVDYQNGFYYWRGIALFSFELMVLLFLSEADTESAMVWQATEIFDGWIHTHFCFGLLVEPLFYNSCGNKELGKNRSGSRGIKKIWETYIYIYTPIKYCWIRTLIFFSKNIYIYSWIRYLSIKIHRNLPIQIPHLYEYIHFFNQLKIQIKK